MKSLVILFVALVLSVPGITQSDVLLVKKGEKGLFLEHKVLAKEGLYAIGRLYSVNPRHIAAVNKIDMNKGLEIDQVLIIPLNDTNFSQKSTSGTPVYYHVTSGDGLIKVSVDHNNVPMKSIREWNGLANDNIQEGSNLIVGFLQSKEMVAYLANIRARNAELAKQAALEKQEAEKLEANKEVVAVKAEEKKELPVAEKQEVKTDPVAVNQKETIAEKKNTDTPVQKETVVEKKKEDIPVQKEIVAEKKKEDTPKVVAAVVREEVRTAASENGYFKASFDQQIKIRPIARNSTVTSGIFRTASGIKDAKYYLLMDGVSPGTIIKVTNPDNNKAVYAKVLGEMGGIRQNQGLDIRISNAAASALQIADEEKFVVRVNY
jgi:LysM repeat protein